jgi:hypothetical protein
MLNLPTPKAQVNERKMALEPATLAQRLYPGVRRGWPACGGSESGQECVDIDVGQFLRMVGWVRETYKAVRVGSIQLQDQIFHVGWCPRCRHLPQSEVLQYLLDHVVLRRFGASELCPVTSPNELTPTLSTPPIADFSYEKSLDRWAETTTWPLG